MRMCVSSLVPRPSFCFYFYIGQANNYPRNSAWERGQCVCIQRCVISTVGSLLYKHSQTPSLHGECIDCKSSASFLPHYSVYQPCSYSWCNVRLGLIIIISTVDAVSQVTTKGELVWPMDSAHKKPYESLLIGRLRSANESDSPSGPPTKIRRIASGKLPPTQYSLMAVPSCIHSQKPYLGGTCRIVLPYSG